MVKPNDESFPVDKTIRHLKVLPIFDGVLCPIKLTIPH